MTVLELGACATNSCLISRPALFRKPVRIAVLGIQFVPTKMTHVGGSGMEVYVPLCPRADRSFRASHLAAPGRDSKADPLRRFGMNTCWFSRSLSTDVGVGLESITFKNKRRGCLTPVRSSVADMDVDIKGRGIADDYYSVLGLPHDATGEEIRRAYYSCMKACHPDLAGENDETTTFCMFVNEIYEVLSDPVQRMVYDEINGFSLISTNPFLDLSKPKDHVFVDEFSCIGCKNCANTAPKTFAIEEEFGRARAVFQCGKLPAVRQAIETCPVDCIHWVSAAQLSLLEDEMRRMERVNVGVMLSGMGSRMSDVFSMASWRWDKRQARTMERAKVKMMKEKNKKMNGPWWQNLWNQPPGQTDAQAPVDKETQERAAKAAAAARRWREYSRKGVDQKPIFKLPPTSESDAEN